MDQIPALKVNHTRCNLHSKLTQCSNWIYQLSLELLQQRSMLSKLCHLNARSKCYFILIQNRQSFRRSVLDTHMHRLEMQFQIPFRFKFSLKCSFKLLEWTKPMMCLVDFKNSIKHYTGLHKTMLMFQMGAPVTGPAAVTEVSNTEGSSLAAEFWLSFCHVQTFLCHTRSYYFASLLFMNGWRQA